ncbi:hypothetical protein [Absiella sp. AM29-15]|uniref:hypothetical protein n=1 Tax=Absiella sp. AM29-15 TaxID=2292278 RepID=UPI000E4094BB|nr:hypothetical protein [Absiella sp. AM29-15]RGC47765.1 hypothetical protein DW761_15330 [Absiella sp. AM29-15]
MKAKCKSLQLSLIISTISLVLYSILFLLNSKMQDSRPILEYFSNILIGCFGSSFIVLLIDIFEYHVAKTQLLEKIWNECRIINHQFYKLAPIYSSTLNDELLLDYFNEVNGNAVMARIPNGKSEIKHEAYDKLYKFFYEQNKDFIKNMNPKEKFDSIEYCINQEYQAMSKELEIIINQYINLGNCSFKELDNLIGEMGFFTGKRLYHDFFESIYNPLHQMYNDLYSNVIYNCTIYRGNQKYNNAIMYSIILEHQNKIFKFTKKDEDNQRICNIYNNFCDRMDDKIESFRADIIYHCEKQLIRHYPIKSYITFNK